MTGECDACLASIEWFQGKLLGRRNTGQHTCGCFGERVMLWRKYVPNAYPDIDAVQLRKRWHERSHG